ncbi:hypothetical protein RRG08_058467 [Elysia crispata]|uniref:Uncharacterized protein n=1 Tax=Elysia crispata TaxID=231223 RepID=A0AAE1CTE6_9GAST|nr:hypothetical protein RRG08_058467 [Elysia crispata]
MLVIFKLLGTEARRKRFSLHQIRPSKYTTDLPFFLKPSCLHPPPPTFSSPLLSSATHVFSSFAVISFYFSRPLSTTNTQRLLPGLASAWCVPRPARPGVETYRDSPCLVDHVC